MAETPLEAALCAYVSADLLDGMVVAPDEELLLSELLDSLSVVRLVAHLETQYAVTIPPEDVVLETMQTVRAVASYLSTTHGVDAGLVG